MFHSGRKDRKSTALTVNKKHYQLTSLADLREHGHGGEVTEGESKNLLGPRRAKSRKVRRVLSGVTQHGDKLNEF